MSAGGAGRPAFSKVQMAVAAFGVFSLFGDVFGKDPIQVSWPIVRSLCVC